MLVDCLEYVERQSYVKTRLDDTASRAKKYLFSATDVREPRDKATRLVDYNPSRS